MGAFLLRLPFFLLLSRAQQWQHAWQVFSTVFQRVGQIRETLHLKSSLLQTRLGDPQRDLQLGARGLPRKKFVSARRQQQLETTWTEELQLSAFLHGQAAAAFWLWRRALSPLIPNRFEDSISLHPFLLCASTLHSRHFLDMFECSLTGESVASQNSSISSHISLVVLQLFSALYQCQCYFYLLCLYQYLYQV